MNWFGAVNALERLIQGQDGPRVQADTTHCLHALSKAATCARCAVCPTEAIRIDAGRALKLDPARCVGCGACLHGCPTGVFSGEDGADVLLRCVAELPERETLILLCGAVGDAPGGIGWADTAIRTAHCLAALSPALYAGLAALGVRCVTLRLDSCGACPLGALRNEITATAESARILLASVPLEVRIATQAARVWRKGQIVAVNDPPVSRRAFFRRLAGQVNSKAALLADDTFWQTEGAPPSSGRLPRERARLLRAVRWIRPPVTSAEIPAPARLGFATIRCAPGCTACGTCERACPTGALRLIMTEDAFRLNFLANACTDCGLCTALCPAGVLKSEGAPTTGRAIDAMLTDTSETLAEGPLRRCKKCGAPFTPDSDSAYCPVCAFRLANPFGAAAPKASQRHRNHPIG